MNEWYRSRGFVVREKTKVGPPLFSTQPTLISEAVQNVVHRV